MFAAVGEDDDEIEGKGSSDEDDDSSSSDDDKEWVKELREEKRKMRNEQRVRQSEEDANAVLQPKFYELKGDGFKVSDLNSTEKRKSSK